MIIGSTAARHFYSDFRAPTDLDILALDQKQAERQARGFSGKIEIFTAEKYPELEKLFDNYHTDLRFAPPELLFSIKLSHSTYNLTTFNKTLHDISFFKSKGVIYNEDDIAIFTPLWDRLHKRPKGKLNKGNSEFFKDKIQRVFVHDSLHEAVKYGAVPLYKSIKSDQNNALTSWKMFNELDYESQLKVCREEIAVLSLERYLIPNNLDKVTNLIDYNKTNNTLFGKFETAQAWRAALKQMIISTWRGKWARFLALNYEELRVMDETYNYIKMFDNARIHGNIEKIIM